MAREAVAVQARPMTLAVLTKRIQAAVESQGFTAKVARGGGSLVVDLIGPVCPDPLLMMMAVDAELKLGALAGLEAVKLYGHVVDAGAGKPIVSGKSSWMSVIDLDGYFAQRAALPPTAFGLIGAEASLMACQAERDRYAAASVGTAEVTPIALEAESTVGINASDASATDLALTVQQGKGLDLEIEDPWQAELLDGEAVAVTQSLDRCPRISPSQAEFVAEVAGLSTGIKAVPQPQVDAVTSAKVQQQVLAKPLPAGASDELYQKFISDQSSWFAQTVKDDPRLHDLAKQRQRHVIKTLAHYLVDTLAEDEQLVDLVPVRRREQACGLILTDQRVIVLSQPVRRRVSSRSLRSDLQGWEMWVVPWSSIHKVEVCQDALRFHCDRTQEGFNVDLGVPYHLRNSIPRDIPVRMVREISSSHRRALKTKTGLAMVAGVMFALGSGFSLLNNVIDHQQIKARSNPLAVSRSAIQSPPSSQGVIHSEPDVSMDSVAAPLAMTTNHEECLTSFNDAAQPHAYATLNQVTQTLQVNLQNQLLTEMPRQQFNQVAASVAQEILSSCQAKAIGQVVVTNGALRYEQQRPPEPNLTSLKAEQAWRLF